VLISPYLTIFSILGLTMSHHVSPFFSPKVSITVAKPFFLRFICIISGSFAKNKTYDHTHPLLSVIKKFFCTCETHNFLRTVTPYARMRPVRTYATGDFLLIFGYVFHCKIKNFHTLFFPNFLVLIFLSYIFFWKKLLVVIN